MNRENGLALYGAATEASAAPVIRRYSNSFRLATSLFPRRCRAEIASIYALVRVADEIVDGTAAEAGLDAAQQGDRLDELEADTERAVATGFSANLVVHAFAVVARTAGIPREPIEAFFASMRRDLDDVAFDDAEYRTYIHGSAVAVGLMCLRVFVRGVDVDPDTFPELEEGAARLGAAFQKVNFLRDLGDDHRDLAAPISPASRPTVLPTTRRRQSSPTFARIWPPRSARPRTCRATAAARYGSPPGSSASYCAASIGSLPSNSPPSASPSPPRRR